MYIDDFFLQKGHTKNRVSGHTRVRARLGAVVQTTRDGPLSRRKQTIGTRLRLFSQTGTFICNTVTIIGRFQPLLLQAFFGHFPVDF